MSHFVIVAHPDPPLAMANPPAAVWVTLHPRPESLHCLTFLPSFRTCCNNYTTVGWTNVSYFRQQGRLAN